MAELFIGAMSGTSQDGIDTVLAEFDNGEFKRVVAHHLGQYAPALRAELLDLSFEATPVALSRLAELDRAVADAFANAINLLIEKSGLERSRIVAVGSHGQTIFHDALRAQNSLQLGDPSRIAARCGVPVVADFRRADMAHGGQGAPLLPVFHHALFASDEVPRAVLNLGGIANLTVLPDADPARVIGFDCGPASCLMDEWTQHHLQQTYDRDGEWAASGQLEADLLDLCMSEPYLKLAPPKSTGRGLFNLGWLAARDAQLHRRPAQNVQRTLLEFTALTVASAVETHAANAREMFVCGGGVRNAFLMSRLAALSPGVQIQSTAQACIEPEWIEASAFAWLACRRLRKQSGNLMSVTGASRPAVLGGVFEA